MQVGAVVSTACACGIKRGKMNMRAKKPKRSISDLRCIVVQQIIDALACLTIMRQSFCVAKRKSVIVKHEIALNIEYAVC